VHRDTLWATEVSDDWPLANRASLLSQAGCVYGGLLLHSGGCWYGPPAADAPVVGPRTPICGLE
jgi:hypothetical protein